MLVFLYLVYRVIFRHVADISLILVQSKNKKKCDFLYRFSFKIGILAGNIGIIDWYLNHWLYQSVIILSILWWFRCYIFLKTVINWELDSHFCKQFESFRILLTCIVNYFIWMTMQSQVLASFNCWKKRAFLCFVTNHSM